MKVCSPPEFFHKNMSHEQLLFTWSAFRDSSMGTKLKHLWKNVRLWSPPDVFHRNMSHEQLLVWLLQQLFHVRPIGSNWLRAGPGGHGILVAPMLPTPIRFRDVLVHLVYTHIPT